MEICVLGTSSGTPTKARNVSATAVMESKGKGWFLVDCGEATQHQLLHTPLSLNYLKAIFITHLHGDHCYGLPGLLASAGMNRRSDPLIIIAPKGIREWLEATMQFTKLHLPYDLQFVSAESLPSMTIGQFTISLCELEHRVPSFAYCFTESTIKAYLDFDKLAQQGVPRGPLWGQLVKGQNVEHESKTLISEEFTYLEHGPRKLVIAGDNADPELLKHLCEECHLLVHESTYAEAFAKQAKEFGHSYGKLVAEFAEVAGIPNLILTHFSPRYQLHPEAELSVEIIRSEAEQVYSGNLFLAQDLLRYRIDKQGKVTLVDPPISSPPD
ncbi:MBL fold metallo-hydrolase [Vibrio coralliilyticus]|nr:MBL fold metallo-hydrolase [Vibrio coralliilyticus]